MSSSLYPLVRSVLREAAVLGPEEDALSEADFVHRLRRAVRHAPELKVYEALFPSNVLTEAMLPLVSRALGRTLGVVSTEDDVVQIPYQWFSPDTRETNSDDDLHSVEDEGVDVFRQSANGTYERDIDEEYVNKYEARIQSRGWSFTTDDCKVPEIRGRPEGSNSSSTGSTETASHSHGTTSSAAAKTSSTRTLRHDQKGVIMYNVWGHTRPFRTGRTPTTETHHVHALHASFPSVMDEAFHAKLYRCRGLRPSDVGVRGEGLEDDPSVVTLRDHQQIVRNVMSPVTPYHSLLLVHATGTGKTMTALGIAEVFRDYVHVQHKQIHIACPRDEVGREFKMYLASTTGAAAYVREPYEAETVAARNDLSKPLRPGYAYNIENYGSIFPKTVRQTIGHLYRLMDAWRSACPPGTVIHRCTATDGNTPCFRLHHPTPVPDAKVNTLRTAMRSAQRQIAPHLSGGDEHAFAATMEHNDTKRGLVVVVTGLEAMVAFERQMVGRYANTLFIVDEAHNFPTNAGDASSANNVDHDDDDPHSANWRTTLLAVIGMLHAHQERMRLVLLSATPMTNSETDMYVLLNLLIRNDGLQGETLLAENAKHGTLQKDHQDRLQQCIRARVSWFESEASKPVRLLVDQMWYNVPPSIARTQGFSVIQGSSTGTRVVCAPAVPPKRLIEAFMTPRALSHTRSGANDAQSVLAPSVVLRVRATTLDTDVAVAAYRRSVHDTPEATRRHLLVLFLAVPHAATLAALAAFAQQWQRGVDVVHLLTTNVDVARAVADVADLRTALYTAASEHRPLWFPVPPSMPASCYRTRDPPQFYTSGAGNLPHFFRTYLGTKATEATCQHDFGVVATPIQNDALAPGVKHPPGRGVPYAFAKTVRNTWNTQDPDDVAYHPKIDTMLDLMECHAGNIFIYTPEPRIHPSAHYARFLVFLKRVVERRFRGRAHSRLRNVHVEVLHKGTIPHLNKLREADEGGKGVGATAQLPTELNERVKQLNETFLATRDDVVLIGSQEVMEGLQLNEVRQVHILDPLWHMAAMEQVMGRAIRFRSHRRRPETERNVVCFLHVTVPEDPTDDRFARASQTAARGARVPPMIRYVGDLHAYYRVHKKIGGIANVQALIRTDALDAVYRTWQPSERTVRATIAAIAPQNNRHKQRNPQKSPKVSTKTGQGWHVFAGLVHKGQRAWYQLMQSRRQQYGFTRERMDFSTKKEKALAALPLPRHIVQTEIDWYVRQILRLFERIGQPSLTFGEILRRLRPYGPEHVLVSQPLCIAVDVDAVFQRLPPDTRPASLAANLEDLLEHTRVHAPTVHRYLLTLERYAHFQWHVKPVAKGFRLCVDAASVVQQLHTCSDVDESVLSTWHALGHIPLDLTNDAAAGLRAAIGQLPASLQGVVSDMCHPKRLETHHVPAMYRTVPSEGTRRQRPREARASGTQRRVSALHKDACRVLHDVKVLNIHPEAVAYALEDILTQRRCVEHVPGTPYTLMYEPSTELYTLEPLNAPRPLAVWHTPDTRGGQSAPQLLPYSRRLSTTAVLTEEVLREIVHDVHRVAQWLHTMAKHPRVATQPFSTHHSLVNNVTNETTWAEFAFDSLAFEHQDALLRFASRHSFDAPDSTHPLLKDDATREALATVKRAVAHRFAEKRLGDRDVYPDTASTYLHDTFGKAVHARLFCTYPRNPATEHCSVHVYTQTRHTGKATVKPFSAFTLDAAAASRWTAFFCPVPVVTTDVDVHARFHPSTDARLTMSSQPPIQGPTRFIGYGEVLNYKDQASRGFVYKFVDATTCETSEKAGLPLTDAQFLERLHASGETLYPTWEAVWSSVCLDAQRPNSQYCEVTPVCIARAVYLRSQGAFFRYFFPGVQPQHPRTKQLYAGWRARKKK